MPPRARSKVLTGRVRPADPFELIQWLAHCQQDARKAVAELVQNSLDAGATRVDLIRKRVDGDLCLTIVDDGRGVIPELPRAEALTYIATHIGHSRKRNLTLQQRRELMVQGQFGIGILGFWCLGKQLVIRSAVGGDACELHLFAEEPRYLVRPCRGRLPFEQGTEVSVRGLRESSAHLLAARRLGDYLALELRGQILERGAQITVYDKVARGLAQKVFGVKPVQFPGRALALPPELPVRGQRVARVEVWLLPDAEEGLRIGLAAGGTIVLDDVTQLDGERLGGSPFASGRFCGVIDFPDLEVSPGARRGVLPSAATAALVDALLELGALLEQELDQERQRGDAEIAQRQIKKLRRAFLAVRRQAPEFEMFAVRAPQPAATRDAGPADAPAEAMAAEGFAVSEPRPGDGGAALPPEPAAGEDDGVEPAGEAAQLFPPGPLHGLEVQPSRTRVELLGTRALTAVPRDEAGRRLALLLPITWRVASGPGRVEPEGNGRRARFLAADDEGESVVVATARDGDRTASGEAVVRTTLDLGAATGLGQGIPSPQFVDDAAADWRSRMRDGQWEVNRGHPDFRDSASSERRQLRYLSALLSKEIVSLTYPAPQIPRLLEQMVRLQTLVEGALE